MQRILERKAGIFWNGMMLGGEMGDGGDDVCGLVESRSA